MMSIENIFFQKDIEMNKFLKFFLFFCIVVFVGGGLLFSQTTSVNNTEKGKIVIVVLDVSGSIRNQFTDITKIIDRTIVENRLCVGDYFVLIPFGDTALPMYSGQLLRDEDKISISNTLKSMKADNNYTDIGTAIKTALNYIVDLKENDYNLYEPLVIFITDGDITTSPNSSFYSQNVDQIFNDELIGNKYLYDGWYYVGIGKNLNDLPKIAEKSGREDYLLRIEDLDKLEFMLDEWISKIPKSQPIEQGDVLLENFKLNTHSLKKNKNSKVLSSSEKISFDIINTYKRTSVNIEFESANATFQTEDRAQTTPVKITPEVGIIQVQGMSKRETICGFLPNSEILGKGILKIHFVAKVNGLEKQFDEIFYVEGKTSSELLFERIFFPVLILLILILIIAAIVLIKMFMPIKIVMEVVGQRSDKQRPISVKINKRFDFGSRSGIPFRLDSELFPSVVGQIQRVGPNKWQIIPRDASCFDNSNKQDYILGSSLSLKTKDESKVSIRFKKVK